MTALPGHLAAGAPGSTERVAVIGGGYAGLAAGMDLADAGLPVTVFEAGPVLGGRARRIPGGDGHDDNGQHLLIGAYTELLGRMERIGIPLHEVLARRPLTVRVAGGLQLAAWPLPAPFNLAAGVLLARGVRLRERIASVRALSDLRSDGFRARRGETVAALLDRFELHGTLRTQLWEAICLAALNTPAERACAQTFLNILHDIATGPRSASDLLIPRTDLSSLFPEPAADYIRARGGAVHTHATVLRLEDAGDAVRLIGTERHGLFRRVIVATGSQALPRLLGSWPDMQPLLQRVATLPQERIATLTLEYPCPVRLPFPMMGIAYGAVEWLFDRGWLLDGRPGQPGRISCVLSAAELGSTLDREALTASAHADLQAITGELPYPVASRLVVEKRATFSCQPGLVRPDGITHDPRIVLAGDYLASRYPATLETAVRSGRRAAAAVISWTQARIPGTGGSEALPAPEWNPPPSRSRPLSLP
ncbi:MAG: hydroxysqualene dehydroxylase HpnE [Pseudomonadota bacterium]|nr:hydroxysqualene dehydroxylase HpnE [Pseudomonadota bacterium]